MGFTWDSTLTGTDGDTVATGGPDNNFAYITTATGTCTYEDDESISSTPSVLHTLLGPTTSNAAAVYFSASFPGSYAQMYGRFYYRFTALPNNDALIFAGDDTNPADRLWGLKFLSADGAVWFDNGITTTDLLHTPALDTWYRYDFFYTTDGATATVHNKVATLDGLSVADETIATVDVDYFYLAIFGLVSFGFATSGSILTAHHALDVTDWVTPIIVGGPGLDPGGAGAGSGGGGGGRGSPKVAPWRPWRPKYNYNAPSSLGATGTTRGSTRG